MTDHKSIKRADREKTEARTNEIIRVLNDGCEKWDLVEFVRQQEAQPGTPWHVDTEAGGTPLTYSQIRRYVSKAKALIVKAGAGDREQLLAEHIAKRKNLYAKALAGGDYRACLAILDSRAKLERLLEEAKPNGPSTTINVFQRANIIAAQLTGHPKPVDTGVPAGHLLGDHRGESLDTPDAHPQADGIPASR